ncbi:GroES-like protein [Saccharata proteae CBS 121410]|uniref:GroES-like protein n=1 Tax=Saccharata proteae CBS 121410 TaxID=1314787 RepID=A0A9P4HXC2_9PEZI|nr:GroES-like protein [Saccharata proteae CBS 121410]
MPSFAVYKGSESGKAVKATTTRPDLKGDEVFLRVTASGLCGTDLHYNHADMGLGHEGVGVVEELGPAVKELKKGDRVGWGYQHDGCMRCDQCQTGNDVFCPERAMYGFADLDQGSMAEGGVWKESYLFKIPDNMTDEDAAPLMCGGATVYTCFDLYNVPPSARVGIIGIGGLGHLAIQFAAKRGNDVVVLSGTDSKKEEAFRLGAKEFYATKDAKELNIGKPLDALLVCTSAHINWDLYFPIMAPSSIMFPLSVESGNLVVPYMPLILSGIRIQGSLVASRACHRRMLEFAARHDIKPMINKFPMTAEGINRAIETLESGKMRYRGVLVPENRL